MRHPAAFVFPLKEVAHDHRDGRLELPRPIDLPDGTEVEIRLPDQEEGKVDPGDNVATPEEIARVLAAMERVEPFEMSDEERAAWEADRQARKEWEKAHFYEHAEKLRRMWE